MVAAAVSCCLPPLPSRGGNAVAAHKRPSRPVATRKWVGRCSKALLIHTWHLGSPWLGASRPVATRKWVGRCSKALLIHTWHLGSSWLEASHPVATRKWVGRCSKALPIHTWHLGSPWLEASHPVATRKWVGRCSKALSPRTSFLSSTWPYLSRPVARTERVNPEPRQCGRTVREHEQVVMSPGRDGLVVVAVVVESKLACRQPASKSKTL